MGDSIMPRTKSHAPQPLVTRDQCRAADRYAIEQLGIPGIVLMENAGRNAADIVERCLKERTKRSGRPGRAAIVCGKGNNGGDGFVIARHLALRGWQISVDLMGDPADLTGDAATNHAIADRMGIPIRRLDKPGALARAARRWRSCAVVVDALLGTGFAGQVRELLASVIQQINMLKGPAIVAVDVPSGLDADTGQAGGVAVRADCTVTFLAAKVGLVKPSARPYVGRLIVADIGAPLELIAKRLGFR